MDLHILKRAEYDLITFRFRLNGFITSLEELHRSIGNYPEAVPIGGLAICHHNFEHPRKVSLFFGNFICMSV